MPTASDKSYDDATRPRRVFKISTKAIIMFYDVRVVRSPELSGRDPPLDELQNPPLSRLQNESHSARANTVEGVLIYLENARQETHKNSPMKNLRGAKYISITAWTSTCA